MVLRTTFAACLLFIATGAHAQFWKSKKKTDRPEPAAAQQPTSLNPTLSGEKTYAPKASRKTSQGPTYGLEQEYYDRMEALEKARKKNEKLAAKPQYSDPLYFGHKRPPKKHKPSKMKFCKECGIRH